MQDKNLSITKIHFNHDHPNSQFCKRVCVKIKYVAVAGSYTCCANICIYKLTEADFPQMIKLLGNQLFSSNCIWT